MRHLFKSLFMTLVVTGVISFVIYSLLRRRPDPMGAAIGNFCGLGMGALLQVFL